MPQFFNPDSDQRAIRTVHAPHWSTEKWPDGHPRAGEFLESADVYDQMLGADTEYVQRKIMAAKKFTKQDAKRGITGEEFALTTRYTLMRMVRRMSDPKGNDVPLTEEMFRRMTAKDQEFLSDEIEGLNEPEVTPTPEDFDEAEYNQQRGRGETDPAEIAVAHFPAGSQGILSGAVQNTDDER